MCAAVNRLRATALDLYSGGIILNPNRDTIKPEEGFHIFSPDNYRNNTTIRS
jgi:hypothetical protein